MKRRTGPRPGSTAWTVLHKIVDLGGTATIDRLRVHLEIGSKSRSNFNVRVTVPLVRFGFVIASETALAATPQGKQFVAEVAAEAVVVERDVPALTKYVGQVAAPRIIQLDRPLNIGRHYPPRLVRDGAYDHRDHPSLMGDVRVLYKGGK